MDTNIDQETYKRIEQLIGSADSRAAALQPDALITTTATRGSSRCSTSWARAARW